MAERVLITGGAGFIGSHTADRLLACGHSVRVLDNLQQPVHLKGKPAYLSADIEFIQGDVRDPAAMARAMKNVDVVYHLAAYQDYLNDFSTFFHTNAVSTALIYELIVQEKLNVRKVIVASSQFVQGEGLYRRYDGTVVAPGMRSQEQLQAGRWDVADPDGRPMEFVQPDERHANPPNAYALSKHSQEMQAMVFGRRYGIPSVALRYSIVQGERQSFYNMYSGACRIFALHYFFGKAPVLYEDAMQLRDFVNIHDVVDANVLVMDDPRADHQVFCVGGGRGYTIKEFDRIVASEFGREDLLPRIPGQFRFGDTRHAWSDISKLRALGWNPTRTAEQSVSQYAQYLRGRTDIEDILEFAEKTMKNMNVIRTAALPGNAV